jgi:hypothetical protein
MDVPRQHAETVVEETPPEVRARVLRGTRPEEVYAAISGGDPLGVRVRSAQRARLRAFLLDTDRLHERSLLRIAFAASTADLARGLDAWVDARVDDAIVDLLLEDEEEHRSGKRQLEEWDERYLFMIHLLGIEPGSTRRACVVFNGLAERVRRAFFALLIEDKSVETCVAEGFGTRDELLVMIRGAFAKVFDMRDPRAEVNDDA